MNAKKSKTKKFYWDPSGEEIYKSKLDSANRKIKRDIREYQKYPYQFKKDLVKVLFGFISWFIMSFIAVSPFFFLIIVANKEYGESFLNPDFWIENYELFIFLFFLLVMLITLFFNESFWNLLRKLKYFKILQKTLIIDSLCQKFNWNYRIITTKETFNHLNKKLFLFFKRKYSRGCVQNQIWGKHKKYNFIISDINYFTKESLLFDIIKTLYGNFLAFLAIKNSGKILILIFLFILLLLSLSYDSSFWLFFGSLFTLTAFFQNFSKKYSFLAIHLPKKNYQNLVLKPQKIFEKDLVGVESVKLSELFKIEGGEKIKDIKILSPKIQVGIEEILNIQKIHSILFQGDTVIFLFHQPFFKKLYTDFSDGMKISQEGEIKFFQKIETMMKIVKKF